MKTFAFCLFTKQVLYNKLSKSKDSLHSLKIITCCYKKIIIIKLRKSYSLNANLSFSCFLAKTVKSFTILKCYTLRFKKKLINQTKLPKKNQLKYIFAQRATFTCSRAADLPFAGRSLPTPGLCVFKFFCLKNLKYQFLVSLF